MSQFFLSEDIMIRVMIAGLLIGSLLWIPVSFADSFPPGKIVGTWDYTQEVFLRTAKVKSKHSNEIPQRPRVPIKIVIGKDCSVGGTVGDAILKNCRVKKNRGWLGRMLRMKTDYIVVGGWLEGAIVPEDPTTKRTFTMPFNCVDGRLVGSIMVTQKWNYPYPLTRRLKFEKKNDN